MEFPKMLRSREKQREKSAAWNLHPDFAVTQDNYWYFNRERDMFKDKLNIKIRFAFDDPQLLGHTDFLTKIGPNEDLAVAHKYIGFSYARESDREKLTEYAKQFPWAELIIGLNRDGISSHQSEVVPIVALPGMDAEK